MLVDHHKCSLQFMSVLVKDLGHCEKSCGVAVVAACMHDTRHFGGVRDIFFILNGESVKVGPQSDCRAGFASFYIC